MTHTLAGLLVAEAVVQGRRTRGPLAPAFVSTAYWLSVLSNNLPDFDFLYVGLTGGKLGYLLHHRGHTHTLAFVPIAALLLMGGTALRQRFRPRPLGPVDWRWLWVLVIAGPLLHLLLDATNNYGVHPFWPVNARWFYGDGVFIIEPYLLFCGAAGLVFSAKGRVSRVLLWAVFGLVLGALWLPGFVPTFAASVATSFLLVLLVVARSVSPVARVAVCAAAWALVTAIFILAGGRSRALVEAEFARRAPQARLVDAIVTPLPATPFCWAAVTLQVEGKDYVATRSTVALWPEVLDTTTCTTKILRWGTAPKVRLARGGHAMLAHHEEFRAPVEGLRGLFRRSCRASAFLRFARAPFWTDSVVGDLRYDREPELGFSEVDLRDDGCPGFVPNWIPPRADLL